MCRLKSKGWARSTSGTYRTHLKTYLEFCGKYDLEPVPCTTKTVELYIAFLVDLLYKFQSGFIPGHSTVHQLIEIYYRICMSLDDHCITTLILCDISKAFDRVWHTGLLLKLKAYGVDGKLFKWFESYISSRKQCVFINNSKSPLVNTNAGVPQGSVLGPLLFLLYVNDIADNLLSLTRLFADDTSLSYSSQSPYTIEDVINSDLESISIWSKQ